MHKKRYIYIFKLNVRNLKFKQVYTKYLSPNLLLIKLVYFLGRLIQSTPKARIFYNNFVATFAYFELIKSYEQ